MIDSFISDISLSIPWINSRIKLISSSFLYFYKWSSVIKKEKSYFVGSTGTLLIILNLSALSAKNLCNICVNKVSISFFLIEKDILTELMDPSIRQLSDSFLQIVIGYVSSFGLSANSISGWDCLSTSCDGKNLRFNEASNASLIVYK